MTPTGDKKQRVKWSHKRTEHRLDFTLEASRATIRNILKDPEPVAWKLLEALNLSRKDWYLSSSTIRQQTPTIITFACIKRGATFSAKEMQEVMNNLF